MVKLCSSAYENAAKCSILFLCKKSIIYCVSFPRNEILDGCGFDFRSDLDALGLLLREGKLVRSFAAPKSLIL